MQATTDTDNYNEEKVIRSTTHKPFGAFFKLKLADVDSKLVNSGEKKNALYQPDFFNYIEKKWLPTAPFWSAMLLGGTINCYIAYLLHVPLVGNLCRYQGDNKAATNQFEV